MNYRTLLLVVVCKFALMDVVYKCTRDVYVYVCVSGCVSGQSFQEVCRGRRF